MTRGTRKPNQFCWINILTPNPPEARAFFGEILGWSYVELPGIGHLIQVGGHDIGGLFDVVSPRTPEGTAPTIGVMIKVEDVDAMSARVTTLGGEGRPAFDIGDSGRMSVCFDPSGAEFDLWQPKKMHGTDVDDARRGAPFWFELMTIDFDRATEFYAKLLGWTAQVLPLPMPDAKYAVFGLAGAPVAGALSITPRMGQFATHWRTYFTVDDLETTMHRAVELGARIDMAIRAVPGGRICGLTSRQGIEFCLSERVNGG
jgi:predicted enzyme related to lactoylglutathione lyase